MLATVSTGYVYVRMHACVSVSPSGYLDFGEKWHPSPVPMFLKKHLAPQSPKTCSLREARNPNPPILNMALRAKPSKPKSQLGDTTPNAPHLFRRALGPAAQLST